MKQSDAKILLVLLAAVLLFASYMYVYKGNMEDVETIESECDSLQAKYDDLKVKNANRAVYEEEIVTYSNEVMDMVEEYPVSLDTELEIMMIKKFQEENVEGKIDIPSVALGEPIEYAVIGGVKDESGSVNAGYTCYSALLPFTYTGTYQGVLDFMDYIKSYQYKMTFDSLNITAIDTDNDEYSATISLKAYCITGPDREPETIDVDVEHGVDNIFTGGDGAVKTYKYDATEGASIVADNDIKITLNNANNDVADGIIVSAGGDDTYVTSADNSEVDLSIEVYAEDEKNFFKYTIGSDSYTGEITGDDLTVYVQSSNRVDADDKNAVSVSVVNKTAIPVFFKVTDDDSASPRFSLERKTGTVKVY